MTNLPMSKVFMKAFAKNFFFARLVNTREVNSKNRAKKNKKKQIKSKSYIPPPLIGCLDAA